MQAVPPSGVTSITILGCRVDALDMDQTIDRIGLLLAQGGPHQIVTLGTEMVVYAKGDARYREIVNCAALSVCDTVGLLWASRMRAGPLRTRVAGVELVEHVCARAAERGWRVYFLGGAPGVAARAAEELARRYPGIAIAGARDGYFPLESADSVAAEIAASRADVVFVGLGFPKQELWIAEHLARSGAGIGIGVGGSFDVLSGNKRRAPELWRRTHLEWLYRLITEPARWRRQLALPAFAWLALREQLQSSRARSARNSS